MVLEVSTSTTTVPALSRTSSDADGWKSAPGAVSHASDVTAPT